MGTRSKALYDTDFVEWADRTAGLLRERRFDEMDLENVAEEIEALGRGQRKAVRIQLCRMLMSLVELRIQPEREDTSWRSSIVSGRVEINPRIEASPSLRRHLEENLQRIYGWAVRDVLEIAELKGKEKELGIPAQCPWLLNQLLEGEASELDPRR